VLESSSLVESSPENAVDRDIVEKEALDEEFCQMQVLKWRGIRWACPLEQLEFFLGKMRMFWVSSSSVSGNLIK